MSRALAVVLLLCGAALAQQRPNIVIIMADDMGWSDIGCYGGEIATPNLDALASRGVRYSQFYNTARCCPTRASLMTGLYPHQAGVGHMMSDRGYDGYRGDLNDRCRTIAEVLKPAGYRTYMSGKWHVTKRLTVEAGIDNWPRQRGFDRFFGTIHGAGSLFDPNTLTRDNERIAAPGGANSERSERQRAGQRGTRGRSGSAAQDPAGFYYTDAINDTAVTFIEDHAAKTPKEPFFLYVAHVAPHWPMHALPEDIAKYDGRYDDGWDALRAERHARQVKMGLVSKDWPMSPRDTGIPDWKDVPDKEWFARRMEVYAAMVDRLDQGVGRILDALRRTETWDHTLILFLADNGGCAEEMGSLGKPRPANGSGKKKPAEGEPQPDMIPCWTRDGKRVMTGRGVMAGPADTYIAYGKPWANASNTPFRTYKHWVHEGGIASPLVAHWPKGIQGGRRGAIDPRPGHLIDIMATCVELSGATYPGKVDGRAILPMEGESLAPTFSAPWKPAARALFWEHEGNRAVRHGDWKLVARGARGPWELYDLAKDRTELDDLAAEHPERAKAMAASWQAWAERANVLPLNPTRPDDLARFNLAKRHHYGPTARRDRHAAPYLRRKAFRVRAVVDAVDESRGVLAAQGGGSHGWSLFAQGGRVCFAMRINGRLAQVSALNELAPGAVVEARVNARGMMRLLVNAVEIARSNARSTLTAQPGDGLEVGRDEKGPVGPYRAPFRFQGRLRRVSVIVE